PPVLYRYLIAICTCMEARLQVWSHHAVPMTEPGDIVAAFARTLPFDADPFQREAMIALARGESVLVTAPTGAGKTLVADFAAFRAMATGRKLIYTTPIKALS